MKFHSLFCLPAASAASCCVLKTAGLRVAVLQRAVFDPQPAAAHVALDQRAQRAERELPAERALQVPEVGERHRGRAVAQGLSVLRDACQERCYFNTQPMRARTARPLRRLRGATARDEYRDNRDRREDPRPPQRSAPPSPRARASSPPGSAQTARAARTTSALSCDIAYPRSSARRSAAARPSSMSRLATTRVIASPAQVNVKAHRSRTLL